MGALVKLSLCLGGFNVVGGFLFWRGEAALDCSTYTNPARNNVDCPRQLNKMSGASTLYVLFAVLCLLSVLIAAFLFCDEWAKPQRMYAFSHGDVHYETLRAYQDPAPRSAKSSVESGN